jgi:hypothetical protein
MKLALEALIDVQRRESFRPEVADRIPDEQVLGVMVAQYLGDGAAVLEVCVGALTDLNYHEDAERVREILERVTTY